MDLAQPSYFLLWKPPPRHLRPAPPAALDQLVHGYRVAESALNCGIMLRDAATGRLVGKVRDAHLDPAASG